MFKSFDTFAFLDILLSNIANQSSNSVDIVGKAHDTDDFNEDEAESFDVVTGREVSKANSEHDVDSPVVGPDILGKPPCLWNTLFYMPGSISFYFSHCREDYGQNMGKAEVKKHNLHKRPVLLMVVVFDEENF